MAMNYQHQYPPNRVMNKNNEQMPVNQQFKKPMGQHIIPQEAIEDGISFIPDIYTRKCKIAEQLYYTRPQYYPMSLVENKRLKRPLSQWDLVLEEMKKRHLDYKEEKKAKQAVAFKIAKTIKKDVTKNVYKKDEIAFQQASTGALLQVLILNVFDEVSYQKNIEYIEQKTVQQKIEEEKIKREQDEQNKQQQQQQQIIQQQNYDIDEFFMEDEEKKREEEQKKLEEQKIKEEKERNEKKIEEEKQANKLKLESQMVRWPKIARFIKKMTDLNPEEYDYDQDIEDQFFIIKKEEEKPKIETASETKIEEQEKNSNEFQSQQNNNNNLVQQPNINGVEEEKLPIQQEILQNEQNHQDNEHEVKIEQELNENKNDQQPEPMEEENQDQDTLVKSFVDENQSKKQEDDQEKIDQQMNSQIKVSENQVINETQAKFENKEDVKDEKVIIENNDENKIEEENLKQIDSNQKINDNQNIQNFNNDDNLNPPEQQQNVMEECKPFNLFRIKGLKQMRVIKKYEMIKNQLRDIQNRLGSKKKEKEFVDIYPIETVNAIIKPFTEKFSQISKEKQELFQQQVTNLQTHDDNKSETNSLAPQTQTQLQSQIDQQNLNSTLSNLIPGQPTMSQASVVAYQQQQYNAQAIQKTEIEKISGICLNSKFLDTMKKRRRREENNKDNFNEEFMNSATQLNPNLEFRRSKYENIQELLYLNFDANAMNDANEFKGIFEKTSQNINNREYFPKSWDQIEEIPLMPKSQVDVNKGCMFDNEYENFLYVNNAQLPQLYQEYSQKLHKVFKSKDLLISPKYLDQIKNILSDQNLKVHFLKIDTKLVIGGNFLQKNDKDKIFSLIFKRNKNIQNKQQKGSCEYIYEIVLDRAIREKQKINQFANLCLYYLLKQQINLWGNKQKQIIKGFKAHTFTKDILMQDKFMEILYTDYQIKQNKTVVLLDEKILPEKQSYISMKNIWKKRNDELSQIQKEEVEINSEYQEDSIQQLTSKFQNRSATNNYRRRKKILGQKFTDDFLEFQDQHQNLANLLQKEYNHKQMDQNNDRRIPYEKFKYSLPTFNQVKSKALKKFNKLSSQNRNQKVQDVFNIKIYQLPKLDKGLNNTPYQPLNRQKKILNKSVLFFYQALQELSLQESNYQKEKLRQKHYMNQQQGIQMQQMSNSQMLKQSQIGQGMHPSSFQQLPHPQQNHILPPQSQNSQNPSQPPVTNKKKQGQGQQQRKTKKQVNQDSMSQISQGLGSQSQINNSLPQGNMQPPMPPGSNSQILGHLNGHQNSLPQQHMSSNLVSGSQSNIQEESQKSTPKKTKQKKSGKKAQRKQEEQNIQSEQKMQEQINVQNSQNNNVSMNVPQQQNMNGAPGQNQWNQQ